MKPGAVFIGWQEMAGDPPMALYNITGDHHLKDSTVSAETLEKEGIEIPATPARPAQEVRPC